jgi:hypothetical protein
MNASNNPVDYPAQAAAPGVAAFIASLITTTPTKG